MMRLYCSAALVAAVSVFGCSSSFSDPSNSENDGIENGTVPDSAVDDGNSAADSAASDGGNAAALGKPVARSRGTIATTGDSDGGPDAILDRWQGAIDVEEKGLGDSDAMKVQLSAGDENGRTLAIAVGRKPVHGTLDLVGVYPTNADASSAMQNTVTLTGSGESFISVHGSVSITRWDGTSVAGQFEVKLAAVGISEVAVKTLSGTFSGQLQLFCSALLGDVGAAGGAIARVQVPKTHPFCAPYAGL